MITSMRSVTSVLLATLLSLCGLLATASGAHADAAAELCDQYATTTIQGRYVVQNNRWGTSAPQCINATGSGFTITRADGSVPTNGAPKSYPSVFYGCHYTKCTPGTNLPKQLGSIGSAPTNTSFTYVGGAVFDASYDIWLDPTPKTDGVNRTEIMVWYNRVGSIAPVGSQVGTATVGGMSWQVWTGWNGTNNVITFVSSSALSSWGFNVMDFVAQAMNRGLADRSWYLTSIQSGFEPWSGGAGLAVNSFSATVN